MYVASLAPANRTLVAPVNPVPVITTWVPTGPLAGLKPVVFGTTAFTTVNTVAACTAPAAVATRIFPVNAPLGTVAVI